jgi:hypothetical protein
MPDGGFMLKNTLFKIATPIACALSVAFSSIEVSAAPCYGSCTPCQDPCNQRSWWKDAAIFAGAAAVGAIAGVIAGNSSKHRGRRGPIGPMGAPGVPGTPGNAGLGFTLATVPVGQPNSGTDITSLTFTFNVVTAIGVATPLPNNFQPYVTTPDGRTFFGPTFTGLVGNTAQVTIPSGQFFNGSYDVGVISRNTIPTLAGLVSTSITFINGAATSPVLDPVGIITAVSITNGEFFNAQYPFNDTP